MTYFPDRLAAAKRARSADLVEIFSAIQGEGPRVGERHLFVRFLHCDVRCGYCDTPACHEPLAAWRLELTPGARDFARRPNPEPLDDLGRLIDERLTGAVRHSAVAFTGGEPLLQPEAIHALAPAIRARGARILLETDGNLPDAFEIVRGDVDVLSMDWKLQSATGEPDRSADHRRMLASASGIDCYVKAVFVEETPDREVLAAARAVAEVRPEAPLVLQPASPFGTVTRAPSPARALRLQEAALAVHKDVRVIPQVHRLSGQL
jgi:organic radical activating enzyme